MTLSDDLRTMSRAAPTTVDQATLLAAAMVIDQTLHVIQELVDIASQIGVPICEDGFRHCCGGARRRCKVSCPVAHLQSRLRDDDLLGFYDDSRVIPIDQAVEGGTVAAGRAMGAQCFDRIVVPVDDVGDRIHGERQQQGDEHCSYPGRWISGQMENGHSAGRNTRVGNTSIRVS